MTDRIAEAFNSFADWWAEFVASAYFFGFCVIVVVVWGPTKFLGLKTDTWQLIINTLTTIITFLLVALLHNTQHRFENAVNARLQAIMEHLGVEDPVDDEGQVA